MKYFYDTEFWETGRDHKILPISIGIVREDGEGYYAEYRTFDPMSSLWNMCDPWLVENVRPYLTGHTKATATIADEIRAFVGADKPEWWGYYADYDHVVLCQTFGRMIDLPKGWPMYTRDLKQWCDDLGNPQLPKQESVEHNAFADAVWTRDAWLFLKDYSTRGRAGYGLSPSGI